MTETYFDLDVSVWILFFICTFLLIIVMLNLLIAFINDSYVKAITQRDTNFNYE